MKPVGEETVQSPPPIEPSLLALFNRLTELAAAPAFHAQRATALSRALSPYVEYEQRGLLSPLPEEIAQANLYLFADYFPDDGQFSLIEQVRDMIDVHVPHEERAWLDPLKRSRLDLLEIIALDDGVELTLRSLGNGQAYVVGHGGFGQELKKGQVLLTRLIRLPDRALSLGTAIVLAGSHAKNVLDSTNRWRREREAESGSFELGDWEDFAKQYGYVLLWMYAHTRMETVLKADVAMAYRTPNAHAFLYAIALYEHADFDRLAGGLARMEGLQSDLAVVHHVTDEASDQTRVRIWRRRDGAGENHTSDVLARVTLTPASLIVECDSPERLNGLKHQLASAFGYSLHFIGESCAVPPHDLLDVDLSQDSIPSHSIVVSQDEECRLLKTLLESAYLEWADRPSPSLKGLTPRHAAADPETRGKVAGLIDQLERDDLIARRTGRQGYDYNVLRAHVGLA